MSGNGSPRPDNHVIVLFGATGDLAKRKLLPGLFHLHAAGLLPKEYRIIGSSPAQYALTDEQFREHAEQACDDFCITKPTDPSWPSFAERLSFGAADPDNATALVEAVQRAEKEIGGPVRRLYHLAVPPAAFTSVVGMLGATGLAKDARVIVEKPFGTDLASARALNQAVRAVFDESQVFRIDHFLGKESVDNVLAFRFANGLFEPIWNRHHIRYVEIDVPENAVDRGPGRVLRRDRRLPGHDRHPPVPGPGVRGHGAAGVAVGQAPAGREGEGVRGAEADRRPARGARPVRGVPVRARRGGRLPDRDDGRGAGRGGELALARRAVLPAFGQVHGRLAPAHRRSVSSRRRCACSPRTARTPRTAGRTRSSSISPTPALSSVNFLAKVPGAELSLGNAEMAFSYKDSFAASNALEGYERLILLAMVGDQSLFTRSDGIERLWEISDPLLDNPPPVEPYPVGSFGPESVKQLIAPYHWHLPHV